MQVEGGGDDIMTEPTAKLNARQRISGYLFTALAVVSCPCHLPLLLALLAGTTAGATLSQHWGLSGSH